MPARVPIAVLAAAVLALGPPRLAQASPRTVVCKSKVRHTTRCPADTTGGVVLSEQLSKSGCWADETWGYDRSGIWVSNGCGAEFAVGGAAPGGSDGGAGAAGAVVVGALIVGALAAAVIASQHGDDEDGDWQSSWSGDDDWQVVRCESRNDAERYCRTGSHRGIELRRQLGGSRCSYGRTWGYDRKGVWVDEGCKGEFWVKH